MASHVVPIRPITRSSVSETRHRSAPEAPPSVVVRSPQSVYSFSIIVPTRNEAGNVPLLLERLGPVVDGHDAEIIFVDDSDDDTPEVVSRSRGLVSVPVRLLHRTPGEREGRLGGAVVAGLRIATRRFMIVMDGDLQHPPEVIPDMLTLAERDSLDMVIANRYCQGGSSASFSTERQILSSGFTMLSKAMFPRKLRSVDDPMTGFFLVRRNQLDIDTFRPNGFKILLEILARTPALKIGSVPFVFGERIAGESKASLAEGMRLISLLVNLRFGNAATKFINFGLVGVSGLLINSLLLAFWTETIGIFYMLSLILATQGSTLWNFVLSEHLVFRSIHSRQGELSRAARFFLMNNGALITRGPVVFLLTSTLGLNYLISNIVSMAMILVVRFALADSLIWKTTPAPTPVVNSSLSTLAPEGDLQS